MLTKFVIVLIAVISVAAILAVAAAVGTIRRAVRVYVYGLPVAMNYATMVDYVVNAKSPNFKNVGFNEFHHESRTYSYKDTSIVTPNADTPYSSAVLDLRGGGCIVGTGAVEEGRYFSLQFVDGNTYNYGYIGSRSTGNSAKKYLVVMRGWKGVVPRGVDGVLFSTTPFSLVIGRTQLFSGGDMENVKKVQAGYFIEVLGERTPPGPFGFATASDIDSPRFFDVLDSALDFVPVTSRNVEEMRAAGELGMGPLKGGARVKGPFLEIGRYFGKRAATKRAAEMGGTVGPWHITAGGGDEKRYGRDWKTRAAVAVTGIYALDPEEAVYPFAMTDSDGNALDGSNNYTISFDAKSLPPARAFWSISAYDAATKLFVENSAGRYLVNSSMLKDMKSEGGKVTVLVQSESPGAALERNWLPIPKGGAFLVMRVYWPREDDPSILPPGRGTWNPPPIRRVSKGRPS